MIFFHEAFTDMPDREDDYIEQYVAYYGEKLGWKEITERVVAEPSTFTKYENGNAQQYYFQRSVYLRATWRPRQEQS